MGRFFFNGDSFVLERALQTADRTTSPAFCVRRGEDKSDKAVSSKKSVSKSVATVSESPTPAAALLVTRQLE
ncbi:hypothetical protein EYF80_021714 [Liparis tanakae]|uniref:Uncharacterized protein n=1 Tax=Liparis tanakae TaxID=230148 RepID=A0A4Z2HQF5_9TELE|nr:hypothetical protein EYF80_021714 [Liparis tanakae]